MKTKKLTNILKDAKNASNQKTEPYDATGIVKRIENGVAWVHIGGGVDETPVRLTMNAKEGDAVQVRVSGGKAWLTGNATSPPTDDTMAYHATHVAQTAQANAQNAGIIAEESQAIAIEASQTVEELSETVITNVVVQYAVGTSPSVAPSSGWSTNSPTWEEGKYIWQRTVTTINGVQIPSNVACIQGAKGSDGTSVSILGSYDSLAELEAAHPTGNVGDAYMVSGDLYVWNGTEWENVGQIQGPQGPTGPQGPQGNDGHSPVVTATKAGDTTVVYVDGISIATIQDGQDGDDGQPGADGDDAYTHFAWANSADGSVDFSTSVSANKQYIGVYADHTLADSQRYQDYSWSKIKGEQGPQGDDGTSPTVSKSGDTVTIVDAEGHTVTIKDGEDGQSIVGPAGDDAYLHLAWANSADGSVDFSTTVATGKQYMGMYSDHTLADSQRYQDYSWTKVKGEQGVQGQTGATGKGISKVQTEYYLSTSTSSATGGSWNETPQVFVSGKYYWTRDHIYYNDNTDGYSTAVYNKGLTQANQEALDLQQYFWYKDGTGAEAGAHITEISQSDFETTPSGGNLLMKSNKVALREGLDELAAFGASAISLWQTIGNIWVRTQQGNFTNVLSLQGQNGTCLGEIYGYYNPNVGSFVWVAQNADDEDMAGTYDQFVRLGAHTETGGMIGSHVRADINCIASYANQESYITMDAGNVSLSSSGDVEFQGDITAKGHDSPIGKIEAGEETTKSNSATATWVEGSSVDLPNGVWVITAHVNFAQNTTGRRAIAIYSGSSQMTASLANQSPTSGAITHMTTTYILSTSGSTVSVRHYQSSGGQLSATSIIRAVRIR